MRRLRGNPNRPALRGGRHYTMGPGGRYEERQHRPLSYQEDFISEFEQDSQAETTEDETTDYDTETYEEQQRKKWGEKSRGILTVPTRPPGGMLKKRDGPQLTQNSPLMTEYPRSREPPSKEQQIAAQTNRPPPTNGLPHQDNPRNTHPPAIDRPPLAASSNTQTLELLSKMNFSGKATLLGSTETPAGEFVYNRRNEILFAPGLPYSMCLQWFFQANALYSLKPDPQGFYYTIPEIQIAKDLHHVVLGQGNSNPPDLKFSGSPGSNFLGNTRKFSQTPKFMPGIRVPGQMEEEPDIDLSYHDPQNQENPKRTGFPKPTLNGGLVLSNSQSALNSLSPLEFQMREQGQANHMIQLLEVSLLGYHNPLPIPVGIQWDNHEETHREHNGDGSYLFILEPETSTTLSPPRTWDLRPSLSTHDIQYSAMYKRHKSLGLFFDSENRVGGDINVYSRRLLGLFIKSHYKNMTFEETLWKGEPIIIVRKTLAEEAHRMLIKAINTVRFINYKDFRFRIVPLIDLSRGGGQCLPPITSRESILKILLEQKYQRMDIDKLIQGITANISLRYL